MPTTTHTHTDDMHYLYKNYMHAHTHTTILLDVSVAQSTTVDSMQGLSVEQDKS